MPSRALALPLAAAALLALVGCSTSAGVESSPDAVVTEPASEAAAPEPTPTCSPDVQPGSATGFEGPPPTDGQGGTVRGVDVAATWTAVTSSIATPLPDGTTWPATPPAPLDAPCIADGTMDALDGTVEVTAALWWRCQWLDALVDEADVSWPTDLPDPAAATAQLDLVLADPAIAPSAESMLYVIASNHAEMEPTALLGAERMQCGQRDHL